MRKILVAGAAIAASLMMANVASAATTILYSDFEEAPVAPGNYGIFATADGWTAGPGTAGIEVQDHAGAGLPAPAGGEQFVELDSNSNSTMFFTFADAGKYMVDFLYSPRPSVGPGSNGIQLYLNSDPLDPPGLLTGGPLGATSWSSFATNWFTASAGDKLWFKAEGTSDSLGGYVDNISITAAAVPEPATWAMMLVGFFGTGSLLRNRRKAGLALSA